jgi:hypothetical protein
MPMGSTPTGFSANWEAGSPGRLRPGAYRVLRGSADRHVLVGGKYIAVSVVRRIRCRLPSRLLDPRFLVDSASSVPAPFRRGDRKMGPLSLHKPWIEAGEVVRLFAGSGQLLTGSSLPGRGDCGSCSRTASISAIWTTIVSRSAALERAQFVPKDGLRTGSVGGLTSFDSGILALAVEIESLGIVGGQAIDSLRQ